MYKRQEEAIPPAQGIKVLRASFSKITTEYPFFDKLRAVDDPDKPPPIIATSKDFKPLKFLFLSHLILHLLKK